MYRCKHCGCRLFKHNINDGYLCNLDMYEKNGNITSIAFCRGGKKSQHSPFSKEENIQLILSKI